MDARTGFDPRNHGTGAISDVECSPLEHLGCSHIYSRVLFEHGAPVVSNAHTGTEGFGLRMLSSQRRGKQVGGTCVRALRATSPAATPKEQPSRVPQGTKARRTQCALVTWSQPSLSSTFQEIAFQQVLENSIPRVGRKVTRGRRAVRRGPQPVGHPRRD